MPRQVSPTTVVSKDEQVLLPSPIRQPLAWGPGARLVAEQPGDGVGLRLLALFAPTQVADVVASLKSVDRARTLEEMGDAVADGARRRHARD